ncbi:hypothetical protein Hypma_000352 [Hypsizygus marmoreus]|uniref:RNase III domain-containing protein n=1 Tax=Hypsizygus marmoreus TaxID=39966 RepID=A0A369JHT8_HYPMA|nr:hypothetical protein Hypma_000352 [Hypsizygus marmoreus]
MSHPFRCLSSSLRTVSSIPTGSCLPRRDVGARRYAQMALKTRSEEQPRSAPQRISQRGRPPVGYVDEEEGFSSPEEGSRRGGQQQKQQRGTGDSSPKSMWKEPDPHLAEHLNALFPTLTFPPELARRILTHASHPAAAYGHNAGFSFIGRRVLESYLLLLLSSSSALKPTHDLEDIVARTLNSYVLGESVGSPWGLGRAMRWTPTLPASKLKPGLEQSNLLRSVGLYKIQGDAVGAIMGGVFHQFGASVAHRVFHTRVLPLLLKRKADGLPEAFHDDAWAAFGTKAIRILFSDSDGVTSTSTYIQPIKCPRDSSPYEVSRFATLKLPKTSQDSQAEAKLLPYTYNIVHHRPRSPNTPIHARLAGKPKCHPQISSVGAAPKQNKDRGPAIPFSPGFPIDKVLNLAQSLPSHSWEFGTAAQALLELYNPELSVFGDDPFGALDDLGKESYKSDNDKDVTLPRGLAYAKSTIVIGTGANALADGDGAVGDPASLGVSAVMLGKTGRGGEAAKFAKAAGETVAYVTGKAPRAANGAISHRVDVVELWADFVYMAPPFLAYYAVDTRKASLLREAVDQCEAYRARLQVKSKSKSSPLSGLWLHIQGPQHADPGLWSTGNAWAAAGLARVLATIVKAPLFTPSGKSNDKARQDEKRWREDAEADLTQWIQEIVDGVIGSAKAGSYEGGLVRNYLDDDSTFGETSGSALMAGVVYRMAVLRPEEFRGQSSSGSRGKQAQGSQYVRWADGIREALGGVFSYQGKELQHVDRGNGTVRPAVNPLGWGDTRPWMVGSPEGQGFVVIMYAAWRDCVLAGVCGRV